MKHILSDRARNFSVALLCFAAPVLSFFPDVLRLPRCTFRTLTGFPCPFCGMTRAFCEISTFSAKSAFAIQPAGVLIYLLCIVFGLFFLLRGAFGKSFVDLRRMRYWTKTFNAVLGLILVIWVCRVVWSLIG